MEEKYLNILDIIEKTDSSISILGLDRILELMNLLGNPQDRLKVIHIAGTNGKGSTTMMLSYIFKQAGYNVGTYISPEVVDFRERIQFNLEYISKDEFVYISNLVLEQVNKMIHKPTHFEIITAIAFKYYEYMKCDVVILETGLGGRLDATNIVKKPLITCITAIDYDHMNILGDTLEKITLEKCGIIKENVSNVCYPIQYENVVDCIRKKCDDKNSKLIIPDVKELKSVKCNGLKYNFNYKGIYYELGLLGNYQVYNAITVIEIINNIREFKINNEDISLGLSNTRFPARLEVLSNNPLIILDGAHNVSGINSLIKSLNNIKNRKIAIISILKDKDVDQMCKLISKVIDEFIVVPINNPRCVDINDLRNIILKYNSNVKICEDYDDALFMALRKMKNNDCLIVFGSLYLAKDIRDVILNHKF